MMHGRSGGYLGLDPAANSFHRIGDYIILWSVGIIALQQKKNYTEICQQIVTISFDNIKYFSFEMLALLESYFKVFDQFIIVSYNWRKSLE